jgi:vitamin B12 transporter
VVSHSFDEAGNFTRLPGYALVTLRASLPVTSQIELFGRIENLGDERYQTTAGYGTLGRSAYLGARARF